VDHYVKLALDSVVHEHVHQVEVDGGLTGVTELQLDEWAQLLRDLLAGAELEDAACNIHIPVNAYLRIAFGCQGLVKV
jgi:hypothetical protein